MQLLGSEVGRPFGEILWVFLRFWFFGGEFFGFFLSFVFFSAFFGEFFLWFMVFLLFLLAFWSFFGMFGSCLMIVFGWAILLFGSNFFGGFESFCGSFLLLLRFLFFAVWGFLVYLFCICLLSLVF